MRECTAADIGIEECGQREADAKEMLADGLSEQEASDNLKILYG